MKKGWIYGGLRILVLLLAGSSWSTLWASPQIPSGEQSLRVILETEPGAAPDLKAVGARVEKRYTALGVSLVRLPANRLPELQRLPGVLRVTPDQEVQTDATLPLLTRSHTKGAPSDLATAVIDRHDQKVAPCRSAGRVVVQGDRVIQARPRAGQETCLEVIPGAPTWEIQVLDNHGRARLSDLLAALDWVARQAERRHIRVVALPFREALNLPREKDPLVEAVAHLWDEGIAVVVPEQRTAARQTIQRLTSLR